MGNTKNTDNLKKLGKDGENTACLFLEKKGYEIIAKNYRAKNRREIDIIAKKGEYIVFAEVKTRSSASFGAPSESVNINKQKHIISAAELFLAENWGLYKENQPRFDIIEIYYDKKTGKSYVRNMESAFIINEGNMNIR